MISIQQMMTYQNQKNGCFQPSPVDHHHLSPDVARLMQLEEGVRPGERRKHGAHHRRAAAAAAREHKEQCAIDMNGLETNV